jgi:diguanylate cyclase
MTTENPIEVARETLKQLTARKLLPTPENFESIYCELTQKSSSRENQLANRLVRDLEAQSTNTVQAKLALSVLRQAIDEGNWENVPQLAIDCMGEVLKQSKLTKSWGSLVQELIRCWDLRQPDLPQHFKQAALQRVLANYGNQPEELNQKLSALLTNWAAPPSQREKRELMDGDEPVTPERTPDKPAPDVATITAIISAAPSSASVVMDESWSTWQRALAYALKHGLEPRLLNYPDLLDDLELLITDLDRLQGTNELDAYLPRLRSFMIQLELQSQQEGRLVTSLAGLLKLMLDNIAELNPSDSYLVGQVSTLREVLSHEPLSMQQLYLLETNLREVIRKQGTLQNSLDEAASSMRDLLDRFISRLAQMTDTTDEFHDKVSHHGERLKQTRDIAELDQIIGDLVDDTVQMQEGLHQSRDELVAAREQVEAAERRILELEIALESASTKVKEDQLTGAYNRRGLAEHFQREISRSERALSPLCVALLDVDNFKQLNDHYGHLAGDDALIYLVDVIRSNIRPADVVARFGGEEFVVLMPDTNLEEAIDTIRRLQRELTKTFFLANNNRLVMTFSAGVAQWHLGERDIDVTERADQAMYQAKLAGKNQVCSAEDDLREALDGGA